MINAFDRRLVFEVDEVLMGEFRNVSTRRRFLATGAAVGVAVLDKQLQASITAQPSSRTADPNAPSKRVVVGIMGTSQKVGGGMGRGTDLAEALAPMPGVQIAYICDVDERNIAHGLHAVSKKLPEGATAPKGIKDFRHILDDKAVDALVIAAPDHWHTPAAMLACAAGKHVYVEKPCSHNAREGEMIVAAAAKHGRLVQHGTQRRTWPGMREAVDRLRAGDIGRVISARSFYWNDRPTVGRGKRAAVPGWLDWDLWQGPAPHQPFRDNIVHYKWHWYWQWGTGELGNNGVHMIDLARWALGVDCPSTVSFTGGKFRHPDDDQQTPDTGVVTFNFGDKLLTWENRSWAGRTPLEADFDVIFAGEKGFLAVRGNGYTLLDPKGKPLVHNKGEGGDASHLANFVEAIRGNEKLNAPINEGAASVLLCHLGNISYRTGRTLHVDPKTRRIKDDPEAGGLWGREYEKGREPVG